MNNTRTTLLRAKPKAVSASDVKRFLTKFNFPSKSTGWNEAFSNEDGNFENDFTDNGDGTIIDKVTGLMWQQDSAPVYTKWEGAKQYVDYLNRVSFAGYDDWRLPTVEELASLLESKPKNNDLFVDNIFSDKMWFWSIDTVEDAPIPDLIWTVNFHYGAVYWLDTNQGQDVKAVRSIPDVSPLIKRDEGSLVLRSEPSNIDDENARVMLKKHNFYSKNIEWNAAFFNDEGDFKGDLHDNGDGTVSDKTTGLMWQRGSSPNYCRWDDAEAYIDTLNKINFAGHADWRLPTVEEFASLMRQEPLNDDLYLDPVFSNRMWFWCSDTKEGADSGFVWTANFHYGTILSLEKNQGHDVRAVRSLNGV